MNVGKHVLNGRSQRFQRFIEKILYFGQIFNFIDAIFMSLFHQ